MRKDMTKTMHCFSRISCPSLPVLLVLAACIFLVHTATAWGGEKRPMVAIMPIKCLDSSYSYVGPALTQMLDTRLSSEGIDTFIVSDPQKLSTAVELSDFLVTGRVQKTASALDAEFLLKEPKKGEILKKWQIKAENLEALAKQTGLFSARLSDTIQHAEDILIKNPDEMKASVGKGQGPGQEDEFAMAHMHPDKLVREHLEQDEKREKSLENQKDLEQKQLEQQQAGAGEKVPEQWFPIPDVYNPESDEQPKPEKAPPAAAAPSPQRPAGTPATAKAGHSWLSYLWPFGGKEERSEDDWEAEREKVKAKQEREKDVPRVVPEDQLPYPPPPEIELKIPEPVPLDQALEKIEQVHVEKPNRQKQGGWLSRLWPWGREEKIPPATTGTAKEKHAGGSLQARLEPSQQEEAARPGNSVPRPAVQVPQGKGIGHEAPAQRQEHVYFGPRPHEGEDSHGKGAGQPAEGNEGNLHVQQGPGHETKGLQAKAETTPPAGNQALGQRPGDMAEEPVAGNAQPGGQTQGPSRHGENQKKQRPDHFDGPIWQWY